MGAVVSAKSGPDIHPILRRGTDGEVVPGAFLEPTDTELDATGEFRAGAESLLP